MSNFWGAVHFGLWRNAMWPRVTVNDGLVAAVWRKKRQWTFNDGRRSVFRFPGGGRRWTAAGMSCGIVFAVLAPA